MIVEQRLDKLVFVILVQLLDALIIPTDNPFDN
ncbi:hypothetical protein KBTX_04479 [wastewater metagenome]|uniref:Uncharacterized protein n=2 Tax=unclassified sequences TaxID=12908 RepID=A0A5B8RHJ6_9ZZZZ|nr:hypothetical protein KBTEX_04479 [uncultured organism]